MTSKNVVEDDDLVIVLTDAEWRETVQARLDELGLTYEELMAQAADRQFDSYAAQKLWVFIGGTL